MHPAIRKAWICPTVAPTPLLPALWSAEGSIPEAGSPPHPHRPQATHAFLLDDGLEAVQGPSVLRLLHALDLEPHLEGGPGERQASGARTPSSPEPALRTPGEALSRRPEARPRRQGARELSVALGVPGGGAGGRAGCLCLFREGYQLAVTGTASCRGAGVLETPASLSLHRVVTVGHETSLETSSPSR